MSGSHGRRSAAGLAERPRNAGTKRTLHWRLLRRHLGGKRRSGRLETEGAASGGRCLGLFVARELQRRHGREVSLRGNRRRHASGTARWQRTGRPHPAHRVVGRGWRGRFASLLHVEGKRTPALR